MFPVSYGRVRESDNENRRCGQRVKGRTRTRPRKNPAVGCRTLSFSRVRFRLHSTHPDPPRQPSSPGPLQRLDSQLSTLTTALTRITIRYLLTTPLNSAILPNEYAPHFERTHPPSHAFSATSAHSFTASPQPIHSKQLIYSYINNGGIPPKSESQAKVFALLCELCDLCGGFSSCRRRPYRREVSAWRLEPTQKSRGRSRALRRCGTASGVAVAHSSRQASDRQGLQSCIRRWACSVRQRREFAPRLRAQRANARWP